MAFKLRPTGLGAGIDKDCPDCTIYSGSEGALGSAPIPPIPAVRCAEWQNPASCGVMFL